MHDSQSMPGRVNGVHKPEHHRDKLGGVGFPGDSFFEPAPTSELGVHRNAGRIHRKVVQAKVREIPGGIHDS